MNPLPNKNDRISFERAFPNILKQKAGENPFGLRSSETKLAQFTGTQLVESVTSKKVLEALADDPDPVASLADIRRLLVGPTRSLHDAMFEEVVTILEESDRDVQQSLRSLQRQCSNLSSVTESLVAKSQDSQQKNLAEADYLNSQLQKAASTQQEMLSEMFLVIDSKIANMTAQMNLQISALTKKFETDMQKMTADHDRKIQDMAAKPVAADDKPAAPPETRLTRLEKTTAKEKTDANDIFESDFSGLAERLRALRES